VRLSRLFLKTYHEDPADAEVVSHKLLARGGFLVKTGAGIYSLTPMMWRVVRKIMKIICDEMDGAGAQEIMMPILQPYDLWRESGRLEGYLKASILFHLQDRKGADLALGPTHEEVITDLMRRSVSSYKDLPVTLYQQQMKFRDEIRPRFGLMRGREFMMKDAYSFDADEEGLDRSYETMRAAYHRIFDRLGLEYVVVDADSGAIGGSGSQEFMVTADSGEDALLMNHEAGFGANVEKADSVIPAAPDGGEPLPMRREHTPNITSVEQLVAFFDLPATRMVKTVLYVAAYAEEELPVAVLMRGDRQINEVKLINHLNCLSVRLASDDEVRRISGAEPGFAGPVGIAEGTRVLADLSVKEMRNFLCGANETDHHNLDVNAGRDFPAPEYVDVRLAEAGDGCILDPSKALEEVRGIEVGHIFKLGTKYSTAMKLSVLGKDGKPHPVVMGCYGIGTTRIAAAAVEQNHDEKGIRWPFAIAPYHVIATVAGKKDVEAAEACEKFCEAVEARGFEALFDDRNLGVGARLKDAELLGIPFRVLFGRGFNDGLVEINDRRRDETVEMPLEEALDWIAARAN
jgi:prolyl-tRNA synthetase